MKKLITIASGIILVFAFTSIAMADTQTIVSDGTTEWSSDNLTWQSAVATWVHPSWPSISGATWIWRTSQTDAPWEYANVPDRGWYFKKTFNIPKGSGAIAGTIQIDADNSEALYFNGAFIGQEGSLNKDGPDSQEWATVKTYDITPVVGDNTILIRALNYFNYGSYTDNPAGLIFRADITYITTDQCKKGGWQSFKNPSFKNQGDCVSWIQSNPNATGNRKDNVVTP